MRGMKRSLWAFIFLLIGVLFLLPSCIASGTNQPPIAVLRANPTSGESPLEVTFDISDSHDPDGFIIRYKLDFGDGSPPVIRGPHEFLIDLNKEEADSIRVPIYKIPLPKLIVHRYRDGGTYTATLTVTDNRGATDADSVTITVTIPNQSPTCNDISIITDEDTHVDINLLSYCRDLDGDSLSGSYISNPSHGTAEFLSPTIRYTPDPNYYGSDSFQFRVTDGKAESDTSTVTVTITPVNDSPTATITSPADGSSFAEGNPITFTGSATDPEDGTLAGGSLVWTSSIDGQIGTGESFTRNDLSVGTHTITLTATDSQGATGQDTTTLTITGCVVVNFPDPNLEQVVRETIDKPTGYIYDCDLVNVLELRAYSRGISDLTGIEYMTNLHLLDLSNNNIDDISPLASLINLDTLLLNHNSISDLSPLASLTRLTQLSLEDNNITNITALSNLMNLTYLALSENDISDLAPLASLTNLTTLGLSFNNINDLTPLAHLTNLSKLWLNNNNINDIRPLTNLYSLNELYLGGNNISDLSPLNTSNLPNLWYLELNDNNISDLTPLTSIPNLRALNLYNNSISDITSLAYLTSLSVLSLRKNNISNITPLASLTNLQALDLGYNNVSNITPLADLTNLSDLRLEGNNINDVTPLTNLTNLRILFLNENTISDVSPLTNLRNLQALRLRANSISDIAALSNLTNVSQLWLDNNNISDISALANLLNLRELYLAQNNISDISPLIENSNNGGLSNGSYVDIRYNLLDLTPGSDDMQNIQILMGRGVTVNYIPQK